MVLCIKVTMKTLYFDMGSQVQTTAAVKNVSSYSKQYFTYIM